MKTRDLQKIVSTFLTIFKFYFVNCCSPPNTSFKKDTFAQCVDTQTCVELNPWFGNMLCGFPKKLCNSINTNNYGDDDISKY